MRRSRHERAMLLTVLPLLALGPSLLLPGTSQAQRRPAIIDRLAKTYGVEGFEQIEAIRYTFNSQVPGHTTVRTWIWEPKPDRVTYQAKDKSGKPVKLTYLRSQIGSQPAEVQKTIDPRFWNDQFWLLLPLHAVWDASVKVDAGRQKLPLGEGSAEKVVVTYPSAGGYSPGDTWVLYIGKNGRVEEITYHRGTGKLDLSATWGDQRKAGPLLISLDHRITRNGGQPQHNFFSNVAVRLVGSNAWIAAR